MGSSTATAWAAVLEAIGPYMVQHQCLLHVLGDGASFDGELNPSWSLMRTPHKMTTAELLLIPPASYAGEPGSGAEGQPLCTGDQLREASD